MRCNERLNINLLRLISIRLDVNTFMRPVRGQYWTTGCFSDSVHLLEVQEFEMA